jgi:PAS domain S-box-containing protein
VQDKKVKETIGRYETDDRRLPRRVLVVEDDEGLLALILKSLNRAGFDAAGVSNGAEAIEHATGDPGLVLLLDHHLPDRTGREIIGELAARGIKIPFIIMTGQGDERLAVEMMKLGAADYLVKDMNLIDLLPDVLGRLFRSIENERRIREADAALVKAAEDRRILLDNIQTQVWYLIGDHTYGAVNEAYAAFNGMKKEDLAFKDFYNVFPSDIASVRHQENICVFASGKEERIEKWVSSASGEQRLISVVKIPKLSTEGSVEYVVCSAEDITDRKRSEEAVYQLSIRDPLTNLYNRRYVFSGSMR